MRLSFVIPTRNQAQFIGQCIDGCLAQNIPDSEVLVVDGASTDNTVEVLRGYGDRIRWVSEKDRGQSDAINKGVRMAAGELVAWINSDDYYATPRGVQRLVDEIDRDPLLDIVYGDGDRVDVEGNYLGPYRSKPITRVAEIVMHPASFVLQPSLLFRRQLFLDVGGLDAELHYTMDYELWIRMFAAARATKYIPEVIARARYHTDAKSVAMMGKQIREAARVKQRSARRLHLNPLDRARMYGGIASLGAYWLAVRLGLKRAA
ncbi:MAG: glycosyltransferase family 2 protein [Kofleriaceae bacterium]